MSGFREDRDHLFYDVLPSLQVGCQPLERARDLAGATLIELPLRRGELFNFPGRPVATASLSNRRLGRLAGALANADLSRVSDLAIRAETFHSLSAPAPSVARSADAAYGTRGISAHQ